MRDHSDQRRQAQSERLHHANQNDQRRDHGEVGS